MGVQAAPGSPPHEWHPPWPLLPCCSGGSVSSHLIDHAPCPCLVVPSAHMGIDDGRDTADEEALGTSPTSPPGWLASSVDSITGWALQQACGEAGAAALTSVPA